MQNISEYKHTNPKQVLSHLKLLLKEKCLISAAFGASDKDTFLTALMEINEKQKTMTVDCGPKEYLNKKLQTTPIIKFSTKYQGIPVMFEGRKVKKAGTAEQPSFIFPIPNSTYWFQRRQFYRVNSPLSKKSFCAITFFNAATEEESMLKLKIFDISATGLSFIDESEDVSDLLSPFSKLEQCLLILEGEEDQHISLEVNHNTLVKSSKPSAGVRVGCHFIDRSSKLERILTRYIQNIEREAKLKMP